MNRHALLEHLRAHGCEFFREGTRHSVYWNPANQRTTSVPRHTEISNKLARKISKDVLVKNMVHEATGAIGRRWRCGGLGARQMNTDFPSDLRASAERRSAIRGPSSMQDHVDHYNHAMMAADLRQAHPDTGAGDLTYYDCIEGRFDQDPTSGVIHGLVHRQLYKRNCTCPACITRR